ncbi:hypothetical protein BH11BAC2_BH11BAC2_25230 [soil metagenome]
MKSTCTPAMPLGTLLAIITKQYAGVLSHMIEPSGIDRYYSILLLIESEGRPLSQQFIADHLFTDKASMVRIMNYLLKAGMIHKIVNPDNRREFLISLSAKGTKILPEINAVIAELNKIVFKGITSNERKQFYQSIQKITTNLEQLPSKQIILQYKPENKRIVR